MKTLFSHAPAAALAACLLLAALARPANAQTTDLGNGFLDHGPFSTVAESRGMVCTEDARGDPVVLVWLFDHRYAYALGVIDANTGNIQEIPRPIDRDCPFASILARNGRYYTYFGGHFIEFDPRKRAFSGVQPGPERVAMSMTEDDRGAIWAAVYPGGHVVRFDPTTGQTRNYGPVYEHPSTLYPRSIAADDTGWIYVGIGLAAGQIVMLDPESGETRNVIPREEVVGKGRVRVTRDTNGRVYGMAPDPADGYQWFELYQGKATRLDAEPDIDPRPIIAGTQGLKHRELPDGRRVADLDLIHGRLTVADPDTGETRTMDFELQGEGGASMGVTATRDGRIVGGTYIPHRSYSYDTAAGEWTRRDAYGQWNTVVAAGDFVYVGTYTEGVLLEWDLRKPWSDTKRDDPGSNPRYLAPTRGHPDIGRPYALLAHPNGRQVILGGFPGYGSTGGGLMFYDRETGEAQLVPHERIVPWHSTMCLVALKNGDLLGGTTPQPSNGGVRKAEGPAELYVMDPSSRQVKWHAAPIEGVERYDDLFVAPDGKVFGIADRGLLFVFDPSERKIVHREDFESELGPAVYQQGPRMFVDTPDGRVFVLLDRGIAQLDPRTYALRMVAEAPGELGNGGAYVDGRLYFSGSHGAHLWSWPVPAAE